MTNRAYDAAYELGQTAFKKGMPENPLEDPRFMRRIKRAGAAVVACSLDAWSNGWLDAAPTDTTAYELGKAAFAAGRTCVPIHDAALMGHIKTGVDRAAACHAWGKAWTAANLAAPVPGWH